MKSDRHIHNILLLLLSCFQFLIEPYESKTEAKSIEVPEQKENLVVRWEEVSLEAVGFLEY